MNSDNSNSLYTKLTSGAIMREAIQQSFKQKLELLQKDEIMKKMQIRYNKYFKHWKDFDLLTCILAFIGLILAIVDVTFCK